MRVKKYSEIEDEYGDFIIVLSFASNRDDVLEKIFSMNEKHEVLAPDVPVAGLGLFSREFIELHDEEFDKAYSLLIDEYSETNYINILNFKVSGKIKYLADICEKERVYKEFLNFGGETIVDLGAYDGDTVREFISYDKNYKKIFAFEPDPKNYKRLIKKTDGIENLVTFDVGAWNRQETGYFEKSANRNSSVAVNGTEIKLNSVDNFIKEPITFLKMDIEGSEIKAIEGAEKTIKANLPKLYICAYHRNEDMFSIPLKIHEIEPRYRFYFCHHKYIPAWESNFYGVIKF